MTSTLFSENLYRPRILVVDDEQRIRDACRMVLEEEDYSVSIAKDGDIGLQMITAEYYDIILLDLMMPSLSGMDVLAQVREKHPDTVIIIITGYATLEHSIEAMKKGAFDFIAKPFTPNQLRVAVGKALKYIHAMQDIADTKSRLKVIVDQLSDGVLTTDNRKRVVLANPAFLNMIAHLEGSVIGRNAEDFISSKTLLESIDQTLAMPADKFLEITAEIEIKEKVLSVGCIPFRNRAGQNLGTVTVLHDITVLKKMNQMQSDFVSMVSHEIRSPLNSLLTQIKVILDGLAGNVSEKQREILIRASGKIQNLVAMASELLDLSRIESGLVSQEREEIDLTILLNDQVTFHQGTAREGGIEVQLELPPDLPPVLANRRNMEEVVTNLIANAIKYSLQGGRVSVSAGVRDGFAFIRVSDTGIGIAKEDLDKIFTRFYRVKDEKTRYVHGTGLGLAIVKNIVEAHHGYIRVESRPGFGSTFSVYLPLLKS